MLNKVKEGFLRPDKEYSPIPFWFWNDDLNKPEIIRQIHDFNDKGVNGFIIHPRMGIPKEIPYLSDEFMELVKCAVEEAKSLGMKVILYDEAMYPSGAANGKVVEKNPNYASKGLAMVEHQCSDKTFSLSLSKRQNEQFVSALAVKKNPNKDNEIFSDSITKLNLNDKNEVYFEVPDNGEWLVLLFFQEFSEGHIRGIHFGEDDGEENAPASSDLLSIDAVSEFIHITYDRYYEALEEHFGDTIIGFFTDEPSILGRGGKRGLVPWTDNFLEYYIDKGNSELDLPYLWFNVEGVSDNKRRQFEETINKKMEEAYYKPLYEWCKEHKVSLTGHPEKSDDIGFLKYFQIPGQDVVWRWVAPEDGLAITGEHSTQAKCSSDSARHRGRPRNANECFGCCGKDDIHWSFTMDDMKWYMDWLFVRGVNLLYPHAFFYSIDGPRRFGERPPDVGPNNAWWPYYNEISNYIKRMSYMMTDSVNQAKVAVLCGPHELPWKIVKPLYENQIEFNYLENEIFITKECNIESGKLNIASQSYEVLLIEDINLIDKDNVDKIQEFINDGGKVIVFNPDDKDIGLDNSSYIDQCEQVVDLTNETISRDLVFLQGHKDLRYSHIVKDGFDFYVIVNEGEDKIEGTLRLGTRGSIEIWDPWTGKIRQANVLDSSNKELDLDQVIDGLLIRDEYMDYNLEIERRQCLILQIDSNAKIQASDEDNTSLKIDKTYGNLGHNKVETEGQKISLNSNWLIGKDLDSLKEIEELKPWNEVSGFENYSGMFIYKNIFNVSEISEDAKLVLDLGEVYDIAQVNLNGKDLGVQMWSPYVFDLKDALIEGENVLLIKVKNTVANKICDLSLQSGLLGPVEIMIG